MQPNSFSEDWLRQAAESPDVAQLLYEATSFFTGLSQAVEKDVNKQLTAMPPERRAEIGLSAFANADSVWKQVEANLPNLPIKECSQGCSWCCHLEVTCSWLELEAIVFFIKRTFSPQALSLLLDQVQSTAARLKGLDSASRIPYKIPCTMLVDGKCSIHPVKPLACRGFHSSSAKACEEGFGVPHSGTPLDPWQLSVYAAFGQGMTEALKRHSQPHEQVEFNAGLAKLLTD